MSDEPPTPGETFAAEDHAAAEGAAVGPETQAGGSRTLQDMLLSTHPSRPLEQVESPWDVERGGMPRIMRAIEKAANIDGLPAIADAVIGMAEFYVQQAQEQSSNEESGGIPDPLDGDQDIDIE